MPKLLSALVAATLVLTGCGAAAQESGGAVVLKVGDQKGGSKSLLTAAGLLEDFPYEIEWSTFTSGPPLLEAASAGAIDVGGVGNTPPIFAAAANARIAAVYVAKGNVESDTILVPPDSPLKEVADLRGRSIAVAKGSSAHGQVLLTLHAAGLSTKDVTLNFLQPADAYSAFTQKRVDAWAVWDPYTSQAEQEAGARVLTDGRGKSNGYTFQVAGRAALDDAGKSAAIKEFLIRVSKAQRWADTHREEWAQTWAAETGLKLDVARASVARGPDLPTALDDAVVASEQELADAFTRDGALPGRVDFAEFVDTRFQGDLS
ncbi:ABC transporter substrate-binding protein [Saccharothrix coeruleofusca]|uniref:Putative aliphatic sulfonates-binding protein n=1 Tax=Saccharothrix coeruleofusca TaxID=33919 RepID=A0A918AS93_9PSEU|nr:ABC transporter substrate-binding protein [Saccharothrix coeruleofusca]MBP2339734.1 sulfonate transport system substrate-binding protein [Saccharothrix coeruleofusca]GGP80529.1 ABC transporter substrate-binding protein [Saccharothrix coeruleofusca]